jgi:hypothetical protein
MIPRTKRGNQAAEPEGNHAYPVHRPNWLIVAGIVITVVLGRASRAKKRAFVKDGLTIVKVGRVAAPDSARVVRVTATFPSVRQPQHFSVRGVQTRIVSDQVVSSIC